MRSKLLLDPRSLMRMFWRMVAFSPEMTNVDSPELKFPKYLSFFESAIGTANPANEAVCTG